MNIQQAISERRSIRHYTSEMPSRDLVQQVLEAAHKAPHRFCFL
jgi:nitroreductase